MDDASRDLRITVSQRDGETVVELGGELDALTVESLDDHLQSVVDVGTADLFVDMSLVTFCDSIALRAVVGAERNLRLAGRHLRIINPSPRVTRLLELTGLEALVGDPAAAQTPTRGGAQLTDEDPSLGI